MRIATMLSDVLRALFHKPATELYPFERRAPPARLRGALKINPEKCTGCSMCARDCPAQALELITLDKAKKRFVLTYHVDRCTFCAQCVRTCNYGCIEMTNDQWELAALNKDTFARYEGKKEDVEIVMARSAGANADASAKS